MFKIISFSFNRMSMIFKKFFFPNYFSVFIFFRFFISFPVLNKFFKVFFRLFSIYRSYSKALKTLASLKSLLPFGILKNIRSFLLIIKHYHKVFSVFSTILQTVFKQVILFRITTNYYSKISTLDNFFTLAIC